MASANKQSRCFALIANVSLQLLPVSYSKLADNDVYANEANYRIKHRPVVCRTVYFEWLIGSPPIGYFHARCLCVCPSVCVPLLEMSLSGLIRTIRMNVQCITRIMERFIAVLMRSDA